MNKKPASLMMLIAGCVLICGEYVQGSEDGALLRPIFPDHSDCTVKGGPGWTLPDADRKGNISIEGLLTEVPVSPRDVQTLRPDIFNKGYFSVFDCLVQVCKEHNIELRYHLDKKLRTHVIDSINKEENWWYAAHYHGGGRCEEPIHRMDTHPYKDWMKIRIFQVPRERIEQIYSAFKVETNRIKANKKKVLVPEVAIRTPNQELKFTDVEVRPHRIRSDMFRPDVITAADVMLSIAEKGGLSVDLVWREQFGTALVQGYYFVRFNEDQAHGRSGFTYSLGEKVNDMPPQGHRTGNNFFYMTSDIRVIVSPEYMRWKWTGSTPPRTDKQTESQQ